MKMESASAGTKGGLQSRGRPAARRDKSIISLPFTAFGF
jgi:hypothetical protein